MSTFKRQLYRGNGKLVQVLARLAFASIHTDLIIPHGNYIIRPKHFFSSDSKLKAVSPRGEELLFLRYRLSYIKNRLSIRLPYRSPCQAKSVFQSNSQKPS